MVNVVHVQYKFIVWSDIYNTLYCDGDTTCYVLTIPPSTSAPPLTVENVLKYVPVVKNWRKVGEWLLPVIRTKRRVELRLLPGVTTKQLTSTEDRMIVQQWLQGGDLSWRRLVWALDEAGDIKAADSIRQFAEPPLGE